MPSWRSCGRTKETPCPRNEELIEVVKSTLKLPLCPRPGKAQSSVVMLNALKCAEEEQQPLYLGSILGIDLELQDKQGDLPPMSRLVKHPSVTRDSTWHRAARPEDGFKSVEQGCYWERFFVGVGGEALGRSAFVVDFYAGVE